MQATEYPIYDQYIYEYFDEKASKNIFSLDIKSFGSDYDSSIIIPISNYLTTINPNNEINIDYLYKECNITKSLSSFSDLQDNWDGYGSVSPLDNLIDISIEIVAELKKALYIVTICYPLGDGGIQIDYERDEFQFEMEVHENRFSMAKFDMEANLITDEEFNFQSINDIIARI